MTSRRNDADYPGIDVPRPKDRNAIPAVSRAARAAAGEPGKEREASELEISRAIGSKGRKVRRDRCL